MKIKTDIVTALLIALAGLALGLVGIVSPMAFGVISSLGAVSVLGLIVASFIADPAGPDSDWNNGSKHERRVRTQAAPS